MKSATVTAKLPAGILKSDLSFPKDYTDNTYKSFDLWYVKSGERFSEWMIPTLLISLAGRRARQTNPTVTDRYYAVTLDGKVCRIGKGPHVTETHTVHIRKSRLAELQKFVDLQSKGAGDAGMVRDRISTRRANTAMRRQSWGW